MKALRIMWPWSALGCLIGAIPAAINSGFLHALGIAIGGFGVCWGIAATVIWIVESRQKGKAP